MSGPAKILVADDELVVVSLVQECLSDLGHEVVTASCGGEAEAQLQRQPFDLLITDIRMPDFDGIELLRRAKALHPSIGAIFMTGYANVESAKDAIKEGALDYLMKPFEIAEIRTAVGNALKKLVDQQGNSAEDELDRVSTMASLMNAVDDLDSLIRMSLGFALLQCDLSRGAAVYWSGASQELLTLSTDTGDLSQATLVKTPLDADPLAEISHNLDDNGTIHCVTYSEHPLCKALSDPSVCARVKPAWLADDAKLVSFPISRSNSVFGYLLIDAPDDEIDSHQKEFKFLRLTAQQTALSIENLRLLEEARDAYRRLQDLQEKTIEMETAAARGEFAAEIGHELKNFLGVVYGNISLLELQLQKGQSENCPKYLTAITSNLEKMKRFTSELMREAKLATDREVIDVSAQLNEIAGFLRPQRRFKRVNLSLELPPEPVFFETDPMLFQQLIYNLANNAADACAKSAKPCVRLLVCPSDDGSSFTLSVSDNGAGMDQETLTQAFKTRFTTKIDGNGFGLLVCRKIIDSHGGKLQIDSAPGAGTTVGITFPAAARATHQPIA